MALSNVERQRRWRDKLKDRAEDLTGPPREMADKILFRLGAHDARRLVRALDKRLRNIKPDCPTCKGTGLRSITMRSECGAVLYGPVPALCPCDGSGMRQPMVPCQTPWPTESRLRHLLNPSRSVPQGRACTRRERPRSACAGLFFIFLETTIQTL
jgi:hypothetical protein